MREFRPIIQEEIRSVARIKFDVCSRMLTRVANLSDFPRYIKSTSVRSADELLD